MESPPSASRILRNKFIAGLIILIPIVITVKALWWLFQYIDGLARPVSIVMFGREIPGAGFATTIAVVLLTGILFSGGPLRRLLESLEDVLESVPFAGTVYGTIKKVLAGFGSPKARAAFQRFVLARLPGRTTPGFLTGTFTLRRADGSSASYCTVYVPTNHLYVGDVVILPSSDVIETDLSVEDGISVILSAGSAVPPEIRERASTR
jgi:uncharacterized membrane protein